MGEVYAVCALIGFIIIFIASIIRDIKLERRRAPDGKVFIKDFSEKLIDIQRALSSSNKDNFVVEKLHHSFNVNVVKDEGPEGLEYNTIPVHKSYCAYINNEPVCRVHVIHVNCRDKYYLDFSRKRPYKEAIEILEAAYNSAKVIRKEYYKDMFKEPTSFYTTESN